MTKPIKLEIRPDDARRIVEALSYYLNSWVETEGYLEHGVIYDGPIHYDCDLAMAKQQVRLLHNTLKRLQEKLPLAEPPKA